MFEPVSTITLIRGLPRLVEMLLFAIVGISAVVGAFMVANTRPDAFDAANRQSKTMWILILAGSAFSCLLSLPFLAWIGAIATGVYYFDVRPHIQRILRGDFGY
ncbi:DUF2516 family protein [Corynebacterium cystitidis]|uniref:DUF2516 family protein n=1 Tax=Corynebacterium cystitidis TaxID=35757 RepID=UPI00211E34E7|nr:DUF2516 family protein [Corynebacterium cystitidis]